MNQSENLEKSLSFLESKAKTLSIKTNEQRSEVIEMLKEAKNKRVTIVEFFKDSKNKAHETWKTIVAQEKSFTDKIDSFEKSIKLIISQFDDQKEKERIAEETRLRKQAEEQAEKERKLLESRANRTKDEEKKNALLDQAASVSPVLIAVPSKIEKEDGESYRKIWKVRVVDFSKIPDMYKVPNVTALNKLAQTTKGTIQVPGIEFYCEKCLSVRA